jgi:hypothetical protein
VWLVYAAGICFGVGMVIFGCLWVAKQADRHADKWANPADDPRHPK